MKYGLCLHDTKTPKETRIYDINDREKYHFIYHLQKNREGNLVYFLSKIKPINENSFFKNLVYTNNEDFTLYSPYEINDSFIHVAITGDFNKDTLTEEEYLFITTSLNMIMKENDLKEFIFFSDYTNDDVICPGKNLHFFKMKGDVLKDITNLYADEDSEEFVWE